MTLALIWSLYGSPSHAWSITLILCAPKVAQVSIVVPAYNCRDFLEQTVAAGLCFLAAKGNGSELIAVDVGSTDGTSALLTKLATRHRGLKVVSDGRNHGKGHAV